MGGAQAQRVVLTPFCFGAIVRMLGGEAVRVKISTFQNDMTSFKRKDDVLTLLIHLGYLSYNTTKKPCPYRIRKWRMPLATQQTRKDGDLKKYLSILLLVGINYDKDARGAEAKRFEYKLIEILRGMQSVMVIISGETYYCLVYLLYVQITLWSTIAAVYGKAVA